MERTISFYQVPERKYIDRSLDYIETDPNAERARRIAFMALPRVLKRGQIISGHSQHKGRGYDTITIAAPIEIDGVRGNMAAVVKEQGQRYRVHRVLDMDNNTFVVQDMANAEGIPPTVITEVRPTFGRDASTDSSASKEFITQTDSDVNLVFSKADGDYDAGWLSDPEDEVMKEIALTKEMKDALTAEQQGTIENRTQLRQNQPTTAELKRRADEMKAERVRVKDKSEFVGTAATEKLGIKIANS